MWKCELANNDKCWFQVRKPVEKNSYRRLFLPKSKTDEFQPFNVEDLEQKLSEHKHAEKQWYYISDSFARPIPEEEVLHKQAYLLFYERILWYSYRLSCLLYYTYLHFTKDENLRIYSTIYFTLPWYVQSWFCFSIIIHIWYEVISHLNF